MDTERRQLASERPDSAEAQPTEDPSCDEPHRRAAAFLRELLAAREDHEDLISIGAYREGNNIAVDSQLFLLPTR